MLTRKNLMHYLLTDQKETELMKIRRVQRGAKKYLEYRREKSDKLFVLYAKEEKNTINDDEMKNAISHHMHSRMGLKFDDPADDNYESILKPHHFDHVMDWVLEQKMNLNFFPVNRKDFDRLLAEARRFDGKKRREKETELNGGEDSVLVKAQKHYEKHSGAGFLLDQLNKKRDSRRSMVMPMVMPMEIEQKEEEKKEGEKEEGE